MRKLLQTIACIGLSQVMLAGCAGTQSSLNISEENKVTPLIRNTSAIAEVSLLVILTNVIHCQVGECLFFNQNIFCIFTSF